MAKKIILAAIAAIALATCIFSAVKINGILAEYRRSDSIYKEMAAYAETSAAESDEQSDAMSNGEEEAKKSAIDFDSMKKINPDCAAWIRIEDTEINYPVLQSEDNNYYLRRLIDGTWNICGSIFFDYRTDAGMTDRHSIIYGHNMRTHGMFTDLMKYKKQDFYDSHPTGYLFTPQGDYRVEFFAGYVASVNSGAWRTDFESDEDFEEWINEAVEKSTFKSGIIPTASDRILTLSTCSYEFRNARYVLLGVIR